MKKIILLLSIPLFLMVSLYAQNSTFQINNTKMSQLLRAINDLYVDTINFNKVVDAGIIEMLKDLDPHSIYIPPKEVQAANEPLQGSFDGIGVSFQIIKDTITIMEIIVGGPSEKVGLMAGDKILKVDTCIALGKSITTKWVTDHVRGPKGTKTILTVKRGRSSEPLIFNITRDKIPMNSINVYFMVDKNTGYIRLDRFAQTSINEFNDALDKLQKEGLKNLIFDLRGNGGGYLEVAFKIANNFLQKNNLIVFTDNIHNQREDLKAIGNGKFEKGKLIILVDENSASASEIVSGAVQDWDRGIIMGRRTFGKGLVQKPLNLADNSQVRLTTSHYYTPTGRCIQKPYNDGIDKYIEDINNRYKRGEFLNAASIYFPDSLKYYTPKGRVVYGGGGIMPDIFIPYDTSKYSSLYNELIRKGIFSSFTINYMETHKTELLNKFPDIEVYKTGFVVSDDLYKQFMSYAKNEGVKDTLPLSFAARLIDFVKDNKTKLDSLYSNTNALENLSSFDKLLKDYVSESYNSSVKLRNENKVKEYIEEYLKFEVARNMFTFGDAYQIFLMSDDAFIKALELMQNDKMFKTYLN